MMILMMNQTTSKAFYMKIIFGQKFLKMDTVDPGTKGLGFFFVHGQRDP